MPNGIKGNCHIWLLKHQSRSVKKYTRLGRLFLSRGSRAAGGEGIAFHKLFTPPASRAYPNRIAFTPIPAVF
jgi:hypothetical protein